MPERGGVQKAVVATGLIVAGLTIAWLGLAIGVAVTIGRGIRMADEAEGTGERQDGAGQPPVDMPLLGVVRPREPLASQ